MALVKCPDCGKLVSSRAEACPECGCPSGFFEEATQQESKSKKSDGETSSDGLKMEYSETPINNTEDRHAFSIEKVGSVYVLFMIDKYGNETKISKNENELSAIDYCETDDYIFYLMCKLGRDDSPIEWNINPVINSYLYRYDKNTKESILISVSFEATLNDHCDRFDESKSKDSLYYKYLFASNNCLVFTDIHGINRMDFDGTNNRIIVEGDLLRLLWVLGDNIWYYHKTTLGEYLEVYSFANRKTISIGNWFKAAYTNGDDTYICCSGKILKMRIDGTNQEEIAQISYESEFDTISDMKIADDSVIIEAGFAFNRKTYKIHKGDKVKVLG